MGLTGRVAAVRPRTCRSAETPQGPPLVNSHHSLSRFPARLNRVRPYARFSRPSLGSHPNHAAPLETFFLASRPHRRADPGRARQPGRRRPARHSVLRRARDPFQRSGPVLCRNRRRLPFCRFQPSRDVRWAAVASHRHPGSLCVSGSRRRPRRKLRSRGETTGLDRRNRCDRVRGARSRGHLELCLTVTAAAGVRAGRSRRNLVRQPARAGRGLHVHRGRFALGWHAFRPLAAPQRNPAEDLRG